jgi:hypothetical protein
MERSPLSKPEKLGFLFLRFVSASSLFDPVVKRQDLHIAIEITVDYPLVRFEGIPDPLMPVAIYPLKRGYIVSGLLVASRDITYQHDDKGMMQIIEMIGNHIDNPPDPDCQAGLFKNLTMRGCNKGFLVFDISPRQTPFIPIPGCFRSFANQYFAVRRSDQNSNARGGIQVIDKITPLALLSFECTQRVLPEIRPAMGAITQTPVVGGQSARITEYLKQIHEMPWLAAENRAATC